MLHEEEDWQCILSKIFWGCSGIRTRSQTIPTKALYELAYTEQYSIALYSPVRLLYLYFCFIKI